MAWITTAQGDKFLSPNPTWDAFDNKDYLLTLASNRLEQLVFKDEPINRVGARYIDGESTEKVSGSTDFLLDANKGNFEYQETQGWTRTVQTMDLIIFDITNSFNVPDIDNLIYNFQQNLTFKQIQSLQSFGGEFRCKMAVAIGADGSSGAITSIETQQAEGIVNKEGEQIFNNNNRRIVTRFFHNDVNVVLGVLSTGVPLLVFDGVATADVIDEQGDTQTNTAPLLVPGEFFNYKVKILASNGLDGTMFLYVNDVLINNPTFAINAFLRDDNRLLYSSGSPGGGNRHTYVVEFGAVINTENPITIPIRLVGACALLALEYGRFPPNFVGDKAYLENENDYNRMQDLPINVQAALEPFLADYESVIDDDSIATVLERGKEPKEDKTKLTELEYK